MNSNNMCPIFESKLSTIENLLSSAKEKIDNKKAKKINMIWLEAAGCSGNIISFLNASEPDALYFMENMVNLKYNNSIMADEGESAFEQFLDTLNTNFILGLDGAVSTAEGGKYNIIAHYKGKSITALDALKMAAPKAKYILAIGTCASFGGISAAKPNPSMCKSVQEIINNEVINIPGCPCNPRWLIGTIAHILLFGKPELDDKNRPLLFYNVTIHDTCSRRSYFDKKIFAKKLGDKECMFKLGCRGPITKTDCPINKWNSRLNWPIGDNTPCIGCANEKFPDGMEPFIRY